MWLLNFLFCMFWDLWPPSDISNHKMLLQRIIVTVFYNDKIRSSSSSENRIYKQKGSY